MLHASDPCFIEFTNFKRIMLSCNGISEVDSLNMCVDHKSIHRAQHVVPEQLSSMLLFSRFCTKNVFKSG